MKFNGENLGELGAIVAMRVGHPLYRYNKGKKKHKKQLKFHKDVSRSRWLFGGNRTGKTECGAVEAVTRAVGSQTEGWVVSLSYTVGRDVAQSKILKYLPKRFIKEIVMKSGNKENPEYGVIDFIIVRNKLGTTSKIGFKSCDQGREKFQGVSLDWVWFDEEPPEDIYQECLLRTLDRGGSVWGTMTPLKGRSWLYDKIYLGNRHSIHQMSWDDNPYLGKREKRKMEMNLSKEALDQRKYGRFALHSGLVFPEFGDENLREPFAIPKSWERILSIDPGYRNPTGAVWVAKDDGENFWVFHDYCESEKEIGPLAKDIKDINARYKMPNQVFMDTASLQETLGSPEPVATKFMKHGLIVDTNVNKSLLDGIDKLKAMFKDCLGNRRLFIFRNCQSLIKELKSYSWGDDNKPIKRGDHCIDALRYAIMTPTRRIRTRESNEFEKDIKRRLRGGIYD